ncbi:uncharacterized protein LOC110702307 [Chenopodium quinoa]|uniref:uncharacterized protein LOC110702307 n=1 Tax=Chenopodium quinoa TaxID=63459 RepID=UPI000B780488|nr:uncharacterized protein LOC110702307 [Chenopodium quinoa]
MCEIMGDVVVLQFQYRGIDVSVNVEDVDKNALKDSGRGDEWCIISDRQKGIQAVLTELWPKSGRRYCCKHLVKNFKGEFPGLLMFLLFWKAARAYNPFTFRKAMEALQKANPLALVLLSKVGPQSTWSKHAFNPNIKCDVNKSNFVESFNATLARNQHMQTWIRRLTMVRLATRWEQCESWNDDICPNIIRRLQVLSHESRTCRCLKAGDGEYEVLDGKSVLPVNLNDKTCACNVWQLSGLPCKHAMRAIIHAHEDPKKYVSEWYSLRRYKLTYGNTIKSIPDVEQWPDNTYPEIAPPNMKRGIGRPARNRRREEGEQAKGKRSKTVKCSKCQNYGHNSQTCQGGLTGKEKASEAATEGKKNKKQGPKPNPKGISLSQPDPTTDASSSQPIRSSPRTRKGVSASQPA